MLCTAHSTATSCSSRLMHCSRSAECSARTASRSCTSSSRSTRSSRTATSTTWSACALHSALEHSLNECDRLVRARRTSSSSRAPVRRPRASWTWRTSARSCCSARCSSWSRSWRRWCSSRSSTSWSAGAAGVSTNEQTTTSTCWPHCSHTCTASPSAISSAASWRVAHLPFPSLALVNCSAISMIDYDWSMIDRIALRCSRCPRTCSARCTPTRRWSRSTTSCATRCSSVRCVRLVVPYRTRTRSTGHSTVFACLQRYLVTWSQEMVRRLRVTGSLVRRAVPQPNVRPEGELYWYERGYANPVGPVGRGKEFEVTGNMGNWCGSHASRCYLCLSYLHWTCRSYLQVARHYSILFT